MGIARRSNAPPRTRRRAAFWTSLGLGVALCAATLAVRVREDRRLGSLGLRRLREEVASNSDVAHAQQLPPDSKYVGEETAQLSRGAELLPRLYSESGPDAPASKRRLDVPFEDPVLTMPYDKDPNRWLIVFHCIGIMYMLLGLNTVCDIYFAGALGTMVERWDIKPDVAGATFMAAGGSAPELFTSVMGTIIAESDVGFGTIVGSAVFNVLFVIGLCGFVAKTGIKLTWWPLFRDCSYYIFSLGMLAAFASDEVISLHEAIILFCLYGMYCLMMYFNPVLEGWTDFEFQKAKRMMTAVLPIEEGEQTQTSLESGSNNISVVPVSPPQDDPPAPTAPMVAPPLVTYGRPQAPEDASLSAASPEIRSSVRSSSQRRSGSRSHSFLSASRDLDGVVPGRGTERRLSSKTRQTVLLAANSSARHEERMASLGGERSNSKELPTEDPTASASAAAAALAAQLAAPNEADKTGEAAENAADDEEDEEDENLMARPDGGLDLVIWIISLPVYVPLHFTLPKAESDWFFVTFLLSLCWIGGFAFFLTWWVEILGTIIGIPVIIMGLTVLAAGTSIPDAVSSVAVAKEGQGDMAISSSIGSNIFDILVGLPLPWIIKIGIIDGAVNQIGNSNVRIDSPFLTVHVILLLFMVFMVVLCIHCNKWTLNRMLGIWMAVLYVIFLVCAISVETLKPCALMLRNAC